MPQVLSMGESADLLARGDDALGKRAVEAGSFPIAAAPAWFPSTTPIASAPRTSGQAITITNELNLSRSESSKAATFKARPVNVSRPQPTAHRYQLGGPRAVGGVGEPERGEKAERRQRGEHP